MAEAALFIALVSVELVIGIGVIINLSMKEEFERQAKFRGFYNSDISKLQDQVRKLTQQMNEQAARHKADIDMLVQSGINVV